MEVQYPEVVVQLSGQDGNAFNIIGLVQQALRNRVGPEAVVKYAGDAMQSMSYDALIQHAMRTVTVL